MTKKKMDPFAGHPKPITRRDFLARGTLRFSATVFAPTLLGAVFSPGRALAAAQCGPATDASYIPFLVFDCAGGAALPANFLVGGRGGPQDLLPSYDLLGWDPRASGALDGRFGLPMAAKASRLLAGILASSSPEAQARLRMGSFLHFSQDDTSGNFLSAAALVLERGAAGSIVSRGFGTDPTLSGGNSNSVNQSASLQPVTIGSVEDALNAISFGPAFDALPLAFRQRVVHAASVMSRDQLSGISGAPQGFLNTMACAFQNVLGYADAGNALDPRKDAAISGIYGLTPTTAASDPALISATIVMNALKGQTGPSVLTIGGCDYHDGGQASGDLKDNEIGVQVGRALQAAHVLKKPFFFQLLTDGGIFSGKGDRNWIGDSGDKSMTVLGYYNPDKVPELLHPASPQIGAYNSGQGADLGTLIGADPAKVAYGVLANYLRVCGKFGSNIDLFTPVFGSGVVEQTLLFADGS